MNKRKSLFGLCYMLKLQQQEEDDDEKKNTIQKENSVVFPHNKTITQKMDTKSHTEPLVMIEK